jgi:ketosteroid isomerase-like protein
MTPEEKKRRANDMMRAMDSGDWDSLDAILSDTFQFDLATPVRAGDPYPIGREQFLANMRAELTGMFPKGFQWVYGEAICEGDQVSLQAVSNTVTSKGRPYTNRYHWFYRFKGDKIDLLRVYLDSLNAYVTCVAD